MDRPITMEEVITTLANQLLALVFARQIVDGELEPLKLNIATRVLATILLICLGTAITVLGIYELVTTHTHSILWLMTLAYLTIAALAYADTLLVVLVLKINGAEDRQLR
jgi:hypothetical protein